MPVLKSNLLPSCIHKVILLLIQKKPFAVDIISVISYCNFHLPRLRAMFANLKVLNEAEENRTVWAFDSRRFICWEDSIGGVEIFFDAGDGHCEGISLFLHFFQHFLSKFLQLFGDCFLRWFLKSFGAELQPIAFSLLLPRFISAFAFFATFLVFLRFLQHTQLIFHNFVQLARSNTNLNLVAHLIDFFFKFGEGIFPLFLHFIYCILKDKNLGVGIGSSSI